MPLEGLAYYDDWQLSKGLNRNISTGRTSIPILSMQRHTQEISSESGPKEFEATASTSESLDNDSFWDTMPSQQETLSAVEKEKMLQPVHENPESARLQSLLVQAPQSSVVRQQPPHRFHFDHYDPKSQEHDPVTAKGNARVDESHVHPIANIGGSTENGMTCIRCKRLNKRVTPMLARACRTLNNSSAKEGHHARLVVKCRDMQPFAFRRTLRRLER